MQFALTCGVRCARDIVLEPSVSHAAAESLFDQDIQDMCTSAYSHPIEACRRVQALHDRVLRGDVRREAAAAAASRLQGLSFDVWATTFLFTLLSQSKSLHGASDCVCVTHVLSWGTCPTVLIVPRPCDGKVSLWTAFGIVTNGFRLNGKGCKWQQDLLAHGSLPWMMSCCRPCPDDGQCARCIVTLPHYGPLNPLHALWQAQWWRWHARRARRRWITGGTHTSPCVIASIECKT
jgi:hypothetical protein